MHNLILTAILILGVVTPVLAYINGGDSHHTLHDYRDALAKEGWAVCTSEDAVVLRSPHEADFASQLIARAVQKLPKEQREAVTLEMKRELARLTSEVLKAGGEKNEQKIVEGQIGNIKYHLGTFAYRSYWETNYKGGAEGGRRIHAQRQGLGSFVALQIVPAEATKP